MQANHHYFTMQCFSFHFKSFMMFPNKQFTHISLSDESFFFFNSNDVLEYKVKAYSDGTLLLILLNHIKAFFCDQTVIWQLLSLSNDIHKTPNSSTDGSLCSSHWCEVERMWFIFAAWLASNCWSSCHTCHKSRGFMNNINDDSGLYSSVRLHHGSVPARSVSGPWISSLPQKSMQPFHSPQSANG